MSSRAIQDVFADLVGQDDNLGDSALRAAYFHAAQGEGRRFHVFLGQASSDYVTGIPLERAHKVYFNRAEWVAAAGAARRAVHMFPAGEINPRPGLFPSGSRARELRQLVDAGGTVIVAGIGLRDPGKLDGVEFDPVLREAAVVSWRDHGSRDAAGFGDVAPDWAFSEGPASGAWAPPSARPLLAVTLRFDRAYPGTDWVAGVKALAAATSTRIVTVAQVARDAPRAVRLAAELGGEYLVAPSTSHADLDRHVRAVFAQSLAVISDRAHGLIIGATEGAYPIGSAANPQKISRLLTTAGVGELTGAYAELPDRARLEAVLPMLAPSMDKARAQVADLTERIQTVLRGA